MFFKIAGIGNDPAVCLAVNELRKYLSRIDDSNDYAVMKYECFRPEYKDMLWVGISDSFKLPSVKDTALDDAVAIEVKGNTGYISGTNARSVLIAAYRFLRELGCEFLRPGEDGEIIPKKSLSDTSVSVFEAASYRHRAVCIEGADSYDDTREFIEWLPKVGLNGFYNQFRIPFTFYNRWYNHLNNEENFQPYDLQPYDADGIQNATVDIIKERGLLYHAVGHGWTCEPFGIEGLGWFNFDKEIGDNIKKYFALTDGERKLWKGVPLNTNLCYSSAEVQEIMANAIADYSAKHSEVDYVHVWLADGTNNHCECDECRKMRPSDYYVQLLNKIDEKLTAVGSDAKIVFLIYVDLLWAPEKTKLNNPDRFVLMFAPITRTYSSSMADAKLFEGKLADYNRNNNKMPASVSDNIAHLKNWQKNFSGDSFDFDYHYMWDHFKDIGNIAIAKVLFDDMKNLDKIGLNGMVSCQCIRAFFPHGLGMNAMAAALWDKTADFETVAEKYFNAAFGEDGGKVYEYMSELSRLSDPVFVRAEYEKTVHLELVPQFEKAIELTERFKEIIDKNITHADETVALSYRYLLFHNEFAKRYLELEIKLASGDREGAETAFSEIRRFTKENEKQVHRVFDTYIFNNTLKKRIYTKLIEKI